MEKSENKKKLSPYIIIILSFCAVILVGTILLWLPWTTKSKDSLSLIDAFFMTTSSVCVTGLSTVENINTQFTLYGKIIMAVLIEIGGLSFLTIAVFIFILLGMKISIANRFLLKEALNQNSVTGIVRLVKLIVIATFSIQIVGALFNYLILIKYYEPIEAVGKSIFHAISSFNNAGFDVFGNDSMISFSNDLWLNLNTMLLIFLGGIGFIVMYDVVTKRKFSEFSLHTKIVLTSTIVLIIGGFLLIKLSEGAKMTWLEALFLSVTSRTAGFATYNMTKINNPTYIVTLILMFIGASPCSTGGGVKTTTFFVIIMTIISFARGKETTAFKRRIANASIFKAFSLVLIGIIYICFTTLCISFVEAKNDFNLKDILFETVSAFGTVGLSVGVTSKASVLTKIFLCLTMFFGRLGPLTIISVWNNNWIRDRSGSIHYVEEKIIIG